MEPSILGPPRPLPLGERGCLSWRHRRLRGAADIPERSGTAAALLGLGVNVYSPAALNPSRAGRERRCPGARAEEHRACLERRAQHKGTLPTARSATHLTDTEPRVQGSSIGQPGREGPVEEAGVARVPPRTGRATASCRATAAVPRGTHWAAVPPACSLGTSLKDLLTRGYMSVGTGQ